MRASDSRTPKGPIIVVGPDSGQRVQALLTSPKHLGQSTETSASNTQTARSADLRPLQQIPRTKGKGLPRGQSMESICPSRATLVVYGSRRRTGASIRRHFATTETVAFVLHDQTLRAIRNYQKPLDLCPDSQNHRECWKAEFRCANGQCLRPGQVCDGTQHCKDGTDELQCSPETCYSKDFVVCGSGARVHRFYWCDGWPDCPDNHADELECGDCSPFEYRCPNSRCVSASNVCDSLCDCAGDCRDEVNCTDTFTLVDGIVVCSAGASLPCMVATQDRSHDRCIAPKFICDGRNDCHNGEYLSDEYGCGIDSCPPPLSLSDWSDERLDDGQGFFTCSEGRCLPVSLLCDHKADCLMGEDEEKCEWEPCGSGEWRCDSGQCIPKDLRCNLIFECLDKSDEMRCGENHTCSHMERRCDNGQCVPVHWWCDWRPDCADKTDEKYCDASSGCREEEFECASGQCVSLAHRCYLSPTPRQGCADLSHLVNCGPWECSSDQFKCRSGPCLHSSLVCDGKIDCLYTWDDEDSCPFQCSLTTPDCLCRDISVSCAFLELPHLPQDIEPQISRFHLEGNLLGHSLHEGSFYKYRHIIYLNLSNNSIAQLPDGLFQHLNRLRILDLRGNQLTSINNSTFLGLMHLRTLHLSGNRLQSLEAWAFYGLSSLPALDLSRQQMTNMSKTAFLGLRSLLNLNLSFNQLEHLPDGSLSGPTSLLSLDLRGNGIAVMGGRVFIGLKRLEEIWTDEFRFCCLARHVAKCHPPPDEFSSCEDLMSNLVLRVCVWVLGSLAFSANMVVVVWRVMYKNCNKVHSFLITNLAMGDLIMGLYLLIIAAVDLRYRGVYFIHDAIWRTSTLCQVAGFVSTFSSELSVFTLTVITLDRFTAIMFPFRVKRLNMARTKLVMAGVWLLVGLLAALPLTNIHYFRNFYGRSGVCLALHVTHEKPNGWEYSVFVFLVINLVSFSVIAVAYWQMYLAARTSRAAVRSDQQRHESHMARRMALIVATDAACWLPIIFLGIVSLAGVRIPPQVFAWIAVFVLPLNAAVNPLLYTLSTAPFVGKAKERVLDMRHSVKRSFIRQTLSTSIADPPAGATRPCEVPMTTLLSISNGAAALRQLSQHSASTPTSLRNQETLLVQEKDRLHPLQLHQKHQREELSYSRGDAESSSINTVPVEEEIIPLRALTELECHQAPRKKNGRTFVNHQLYD
ncbi:G-protein coupled receptor GRL101-like [Oratosquilla oratoria]|uniref:G-protein coupled receptor GRL101-like n=1 Tax=Oratosquilla oratoria TaxID=337810 RepID=UPI003F7678DD